MLETTVACSGAAPNSRANNFAGGMILGIAYNFHFATTLCDFISLWHRVGGVVSSLSMEVRPKLSN
jgi:hypothetical protein